MGTLNLLIGISGSGKSTYADSIGKYGGYQVFSSDKLRAELYGDENDQTHNKEVFAELNKRVVSALKKGYNVCYDATNLSAKRRIAFIELLKKEGVDCNKRCSVIFRNIKKCVESDAERERSVGVDVILKQAMQFEVPTLEEGWDMLFCCNSRGLSTSDYTPSAFVDSLRNYDQGNHHHKLTLGEHMARTKVLCTELSRDLNYRDRNCLILASEIHDIGKPMTRVLNKKGEFSYYNHQNVGAYLSFLFSNKNTFSDSFEIAWYVQNHMAPYFWTDNAQEEKFIKKWGKRRYDNLMILHDADKQAH